MGSIGGLIYVLRQTDSGNRSTASELELAPEATASESEKVAETIPDESNTLRSEPVDKLPAAVETQATQPFQSLDSNNDTFRKPGNSIKTAKLLNDCWFKVRPFLVEIQAETPLGSQFATGTIVDSRGWILTSYRAVAGAKQIDIRQARKSIPDETGTEPLVDQVRGFIAADLEHDLVLLSINPRFVVAFNDLPIADVDKLVGSQYLIQCMPPTESYPWSMVESRIVRRIQLAEMDSHAAEKMVRLGFHDENLRWIQHQQLSPLRIGAPLFNDQSQLVAMNTSGVDEIKQDILAVPATFILELKQLGRTELQPLPVPQFDIDSKTLSNEQQETDAIVDESSEMPVAHSGSSLRELSETINRLGSDCQLFGWWPTTVSETKILGEFAVVLVAAQHQIVAVNDDPDVETLRLQVTDWTGKMTESLSAGTARGRDAHFEFNRRLATNPMLSLAGNRMFIGFAFVEFSAMESPKMAIDQGGEQDSIVFEFNGSERRVISNLSSNWPPLPPDSHWLIIGERLEGEVRLNSPDKQATLLQKTKVHFVLQAKAR